MNAQTRWDNSDWSTRLQSLLRLRKKWLGK